MPFELISDEEMGDIQVKYSRNLSEGQLMMIALRGIAQAQRDFCEKQYPEKLREIKKELENGSFGLPNALTKQSQKDWQAFWKGLGV